MIVLSVIIHAFFHQISSDVSVNSCKFSRKYSQFCLNLTKKKSIFLRKILLFPFFLCVKSTNRGCGIVGRSFYETLMNSAIRSFWKCWHKMKRDDNN